MANPFDILNNVRNFEDVLNAAAQGLQQIGVPNPFAPQPQPAQPAAVATTALRNGETRAVEEITRNEESQLHTLVQNAVEQVASLEEQVHSDPVPFVAVKEESVHGEEALDAEAAALVASTSEVVANASEQAPAINAGETLVIGDSLLGQEPIPRVIEDGIRVGPKSSASHQPIPRVTEDGIRVGPKSSPSHQPIPRVTEDGIRVEPKSSPSHQPIPRVIEDGIRVEPKSSPSHQPIPRVTEDGVQVRSKSSKPHVSSEQEKHHTSEERAVIESFPMTLEAQVIKSRIDASQQPLPPAPRLPQERSEFVDAAVKTAKESAADDKRVLSKKEKKLLKKDAKKIARKEEKKAEKLKKKEKKETREVKKKQKLQPKYSVVLRVPQ